MVDAVVRIAANEAERLGYSLLAQPILVLQEDTSPPTYWLLPANADPAQPMNWEDVTPVGTTGSGFVSGNAIPSPVDGVDGDTYFDRTGGDFYSPKTAGSWPAAPAVLKRRYATLPGEIGVLDNTYHPGHNRRYGIRPDGDRALGTGTNWENAYPARMAAWWKSWTLPGAEGFAERGYSHGHEHCRAAV